VTTHVEAHPGWDRRRLVYGDWSWLVRDGLDVIRLASGCDLTHGIEHQRDQSRGDRTRSV